MIPKCGWSLCKFAAVYTRFAALETVLHTTRLPVLVYTFDVDQGVLDGVQGFIVLACIHTFVDAKIQAFETGRIVVTAGNGGYGAAGLRITDVTHQAGVAIDIRVAVPLA